ncbi:hypothetical protein B0H65DRAFT_511192 [Neurospora tetraspora]|uniref:Gfd2/YDR514C-like C-terminal domain-containing protein n=1 Tax=Neurospora tetraspora TaxID=94610 RepID=A0AAE0J9M3_9PEZI|nr:hypothetical protein B0H65DRAFT_511192 [Neurospora tetraspora]
MAPMTPAPPMVWDHESLLSFKKELEDAILITIDLEGVDHLVKKFDKPAPTNYEKLSEVGIATYDPREKVSTSTTNDMEVLGSCIRAHHTIVHQFRRVTEETCPAGYHKRFAKDPKKQHAARPYHCAFAKSIIKPTQQALEGVKNLIKELSGQNLTKSEVQSGKDRHICILYWAANMEETVFSQAGIDLTTAGSQVTIWDMQLWSIFQIRFQKGQAKGEEAFKSLGALGDGLNLHNATNDCVAQLLSLLKVLSMQESEWNSWFHQLADLPLMPMSWMKASIYQHNFNMRPRTLHDNAYTRASQGQSSKHFKNQSAYQHRQQTQHINTQTTTKPSINTQTTSKPSVNTQTTSKPTQDTSSSKKSDESQKEIAPKGKENTAPVANTDEVSQFWAKYDKSKVSSAMGKYRRPTTAAVPKSEHVSGWPAGMPGW